MNDKFSSFQDIILECLRVLSRELGFYLGFYLFHIFISDLFLTLNSIEIASYTDDNTPYCSYKNFGDVITCLERAAHDLFACFNNNGMKADADKCHLLSTKEKLKANISNYTIMNSDKEWLLSINMDEPQPKPKQ